jgi:hypothetical protein
LKIIAPLFDLEDEEDEEIEGDLAWDEIAGDEGCDDLVSMMLDKDPTDEDWIPPELRKRVKLPTKGVSWLVQWLNLC